MHKLILVIGTDDGKHLSQGHLGDSSKFLVYSLYEDGSWELLKEENNEAQEDEEKHGGEGKMKKILSILGPVDLIVSKKSSPNFKRIASSTPIQPVRVACETVEEALQILSSRFNRLREMIEKRRNGFREERIPRFP